MLIEASHSSPTVERHNAVANEFAKTAEGTRDSEALRVLKLLEQEHRRLAKLVHSRTHPRLKKDTSSLDESTFDEHTLDSPPHRPTSDISSDLPIDAPARHSSPTIERRPARPLNTSAIANNLATARGIPSATQRHSHSHSRSTTSNAPPTRLPVGVRAESKATPTTAASDASAAGLSTRLPSPTKPAPPTPDDGFHRFYANFEGLWSKLSAPLAFAGLPLPTDPPAPSEKPTTDPGPPPNLDSIYSRAALQALRHEHGAALPTPSIQESFLLIPPTPPPLDASAAFVDARESQPPDARGARTGKTLEELELENASLKGLTDRLSQRLYMWEKNAQSQTSALQQSIRHLAPPPGGPGERAGVLEAELREARREGERQAREVQKLRAVVERYRERWEKLKEGARGRRESGTGGEGVGG